MQTYSLLTLILFFKSQQRMGYEAIEIIAGIIDDDNLPDEDKKDGILWILHKYGLNETTFKEGRFEPACNLEVAPVEPKKPILDLKYTPCLIVQLQTVNMLNGRILFEIPLN